MNDQPIIRCTNRKSIVAIEVAVPGETEEGSRQLRQALAYLGMAAASFLEVAVLERLAAELGAATLARTEIYSIHGFSHIFFGIALASTILFLRPKSSVRVVILGVLLECLVWVLHEGLWLGGEPLDSVEDVILSVLSASAFLCFIRRKDEPRP